MGIGFEEFEALRRSTFKLVGEKTSCHAGTHIMHVVISPVDAEPLPDIFGSTFANYFTLSPHS
jgi:hypothetical protein